MIGIHWYDFVLLFIMLVVLAVVAAVVFFLVALARKMWRDSDGPARQ